MKEYIYEAEHSWEKQRRPVVVDHQPRQRHQRHPTGDDAAMDADASSMSETTSESGVSDLETSMTDFRCSCCPYGYHLDTDFMKFLDDMYGPDVLRTLKKIEQKRHDVRRRLINEQPNHTIPVQTCSQQMNTTSSSSFDNQILRETLLELDRIVEKDIKELEAECHRHAHSRTQTNRSGHLHQQRSRSVDSRRHLRPPPPPPLPPPRPSACSSTGLATGFQTSSSSHTAEEQHLYERHTQTEKTITTRTRSAPRLNVTSTDNMSSLRKINTTSGGPITMLYKIPPPPFSRSSSTSSLTTETTLRVSSPEPEEREPLKPLYITEITVPPKRIVPIHEPRKTTVVTITDKTEIERRNREIERLERERQTLLTEKEILLKEIDRYKHRPAIKVPEQKPILVNIVTDHEQVEKIHTHHIQPTKPSTREVAMQHIVEDEKPPPLPPKQRQQRDVAISHRTEYDDDEKQIEIVRRKLEEIENFYTERIHYLEDRIIEQEKDIERLSEPKSQRHVNTQCQPTMQDRALVTDTFRSVRDVALTCHLQPTLPGPVARRDVNLQCNKNDLIQQRDVSMEVIPDIPMKRDVSIGVSIGVTSDKHYRDVGTHVNFDYKPEIRQRDVAIMFVPEPIQKYDQSSNTNAVQTKDFSAFANTIEPPKLPSKPSMRPAATDTRNLIIQKDSACGVDDIQRGRDISTDTSSLQTLADRASGLDFPRELLSRHISTDTRTLISTRDNFSATAPIVPTVQIHAQTQSTSTVQHDASSNTFPPVEQRHTSVQAVQEPPIVKHNTTSIDLSVFHQLGHLRHNVSNTESKRSTDRSTVTERQQLRDLAINTEPKIMYSKDVGDFDVRIGEEDEREYIEHEEFSWNTLHGRRPSLHKQRVTLDCGLQTDLSNTKREVGYIERPLLKQREDIIEEQRDETITFHISRQSPETTTEETYEALITTEVPQTMNKFEEIQSHIQHDNTSMTTIRNSEYGEWSQIYGNETKKSTIDIKTQEDTRSRSPEELVEESYEIVSTITKPFETTSYSTTSTKQRDIDLISAKPASSEDDSSYCEEWTVTEAKRKKDGQTVKTIIDRGGHHRYNIDTQQVNISSKDTSSSSTTTTTTTTASQLRHHSGESSNANLRTQIQEHEEITQVSPSTVLKTTIYEAHRTIGAGQPVIGATSTGFRTFPTCNTSTSHSQLDTADEQHVEEKYEVTLSTYDETGLRMVSTEPMPTISIMDEEFKLDEEMYIACAIVNESLYDKNADKKKVNNCLHSIQQEWFRISSQKQVNGRLVSGYLNSIKEHFSNFLLERIVNLQDANGNTALHYCVTNGHWHVVTMLLDTKVCDVCLQNNAGYTAVMMAAVIDITNDEQKQIVRRLFRESGNVNVKTTASNQTALMLAVKHEKADLVELLLDNGAAVNLQDSDGSTALMVAVEQGSLNIIKLLLTRSECDVNITDNDGQTAVSIATNKDRKDILVALYAKMKERKGHHSALGNKSRTTSSSISSRLPAPDRFTVSSSNSKTSTETTPSSSKRSSGDSGSGTGPTVSTFRRF